MTDSGTMHDLGAGPHFKRFWAAQTLSQFGTRIGTFGMPVIAVQSLHAGNREVGILAAAATVAFLLVGLPAGSWVDRWRKRRTMMAAASVRAAATLAVPVLWLTGGLHLWHLYVVAAVVGVATVFFDVAYQSFVPLLVPDAEVGRANARLETTAQLATTGGPAVGGLIARVAGAPAVLLVDAVAYLLSLACLATVADPAHPRPAAPRSLAADIAEGLRFVRDQPVIRRLVASMAVSNLFATMVGTLTPVLVLRTIGLDPLTLGVVMACGSLGGAAGAALTPLLRRRFPVGAVIAGGLLAAGGFVLLVPLAGLAGPSHKLLAGALLVVAETGMMAAILVFNVSQLSVRQSLCPKHLLGRMVASIRFVVWGSMPVAALLAGWLATTAGILPALWVGGAGSLLTALPVLGLDRLLPREPSLTP